MEEILHRPRRSVLYVPGSNEKAHSKIPTLDVDALIYDLEDAVAPAAKDQARLAINKGNFICFCGNQAS